MLAYDGQRKKKGSFVMCEQWRSRSAHPSAQSDLFVSAATDSVSEWLPGTGTDETLWMQGCSEPVLSTYGRQDRSWSHCTNAQANLGFHAYDVRAIFYIACHIDKWAATLENIPSHMCIGLDKSGYQVNIFLISQRKHMLWVLIRSASENVCCGTH